MDNKKIRRSVWVISLIGLLTLGLGLYLWPSSTSKKIGISHQDTTVVPAKKKTTVIVHVTDTLCIKRPVTILPPQEEIVYATVEVDPEFPGGYNALNNYIEEYLEYPSMDREYGIEYKGTLILGIDPSGKVTDIDMIPTPTKDLRESVIRFSKKMPRFKPAFKNGRYVASKIKIPLSFRFAD